MLKVHKAWPTLHFGGSAISLKLHSSSSNTEVVKAHGRL